MGRSTATCFKIITCGSNSADDTDEIEAPESKCSSDRRGWSFRKRSARHRVLSNTVISETQSGNKDIPEPVGIYSQATQPNSNIPGKTVTEQLNSTFPDKTNSTEPLSNNPETTDVKEPESEIPEKPSTVESTDEKPPSPASADNKLVETADDNEEGVTVKEPDVIIIQTAIRVFLAQNSLLKHKSAIKLQAAVRGHQVRSHAVGTLRCIQAIVKMQALVRARKNMGTENSSRKLQGSYVSIDKLLSNRFARQLLESSPRTKTINIKCDPSKSDSAWIWLERWMSVSTKLSPNTEIIAEQPENEEVEHSDKHLEDVTQSASNSEPTVFESSKDASAIPSESDEYLTTYQANHSASPSVTLKLEESHPQDLSEETSRDEMGSFPLPSEENVMHPEEHSSFPVKTEIDENEQLNSMKGKKLSLGSRKASNPAFIAAQSKFEELTLTAKVTSLSSQETETESSTDKTSSDTNNVAKTSEISLPDNSGLHSSVLVMGSECGTELSISSTLDSPDRSEVRIQEFEQEEKASMEDTTAHHHMNNDNMDTETRDQTSSKNVPNIDSVNSESKHSGTEVAPVLPQVEHNPETHATDVQTEAGPEVSCQGHKLSPEPSPRSHITISESQGTPSSEVSVKPKIRTGKSGSHGKRRLSSAGIRSPSNPNQDAVGTTSLDQLPKDHGSGKRRNSFGSAKSEHADQEPRDSSSSNSLPSYMQATESARMKAISNSSPRSSPDVHNKDAYIKKRHSLPGSNGRHGSPNIQRSLSLAQQSAKGNGTLSPQERRWQR